VLSLGCRASTAGGPPTPSASAFGQPAARSIEQIRREGNHLVGSTSAYLLQHAHNPVDWRPWGPEALALAARLGRPIFLSIGYVSCHWCHVMAKDVFEQDDVAAFLNEHFVSIKVDREERPDLDAVYMEAVEEISGSGGWPMTAFLTPSLHPFFAGTYFPHERFLQVIHAVEERFRTAPGDAENRGAEVARRIAATEPAGEGSAFGVDELHELARRALSSFDDVHGGFRGGAKFPTPIRWRFLLDAFRKWGDPELGSAVGKTIDAIAAGGIHDHVGGGFFRYATEATWTIPHFEKMLYDNAQLAALYLAAAAAFDDARYRAVGLDTLDFLLRDMRAPEGGFGSSFDADTDGKEGATYLFTPAEVRAAVGDEDGDAAAFLGVTEAGNFEGSSVPTLRGASVESSANVKRWPAWRAKLLAARVRRAQPSFDSKMVTAWNGLAVGALAQGYRVSGERRFLDAAEQAAAAVLRLNRRAGGELARASSGGHAGEAAILDDYAFLATGLLDLFEATNDPGHLETALSLVAQATARFADPAGAWFLTSGSDQEPLGRRISVEDGVEPSGNAAMLLLLERLAALTGRNDFTVVVQRALHHYADVVRQRGLDMAGWMDGALLDAGPFYELVIAGEGRSLRDTWNRLLPSWTAGVQVPEAGPSPAL